MARKRTNSDSSYEQTQTIDLTRMLPAEVTTSGSFDLRSMETSHFGKFLQAIPLPILLIDESLQVVFANDACTSILLSQYGAAEAWLQSLLPDSSSAHTIDELVREVLTTRKTLTTEMYWDIHEREIWGRLTLRPVRIAGERVTLLLVEDLTSEKDRLKDAVRHERELAEVNERLGREISHRIASEEALREREERYRHLVEHASDGIYSTDVNGFFTFVNGTAARMCGYSPEEMLGKHYLDVIHPSHRKRVEEFYSIQFVKRLPHTYCEFPLLTTYGDVRWLGQSAQTIIKGHKVVGFQAVARDITDRKRLEAALRREKERFQVLAEHAPFGMVMVAKDGKFEYINPKFRELFGYELSDIPMGKEWCRRAYPDDDYRHRVISAWLEDLSQTPLGEARPRTFTVRCTDGTSKIISFIKVQLSSGDHIVTCEDITERTKAQEEVRQTKQLLEAVINATPDIVLSLDKDMTVRLCNASAVEGLGTTTEEIVGKNVADFLPPELAATRKAVLDMVVESGKPSRFEDKQGGLYLDHVVAPIFGNDEKVGSVVVVARDITSLRQAQEAEHQNALLLKTILSASPVGIGLATWDGELGWVNDAWSAIFGFENPDDLLHENIRSLCSSREEFHQVDQIIYQTVWEGGVAEIDATMRRKDGSLFDAFIRASAVDHLDPTKGLICAITDVTDRRRAEQELRESEERYRLLVNMSPDGIGVYSGDVFLFANEAGARLLGTTPEQVVGRPVMEFVHPQFRDAVKERMRRVVESREAIPLHEAQVARVDGSVRDVEVIEVPITYEGRPAGQLVTRDVTERKRVEEALRRSEEKIAAILGAQTDHMSMLDEDHTIMWANEAALQRFGKDLVGQKCYRAYHRRDQVCDTCIVERCFADGSMHEHETEVITEEGTRLTFWCTATPVQRHQDGNPKLVLEISRDISDRKRAELALRKSEERLELALKGGDLGLWDYNLQTGEAVISARRAEMVGYTLEEAEPHITWWGRQVHPDDVQRVRKAFNDHVKGRKALYECEHRLRDRSGNYVWVLARGRVVEWDERGNPVRLVGTSLDITERKLTEEALKESEAKFREFAEAVPQVVYELDAQGNFTFLNRAGLELGGYGQEDIDKEFKITDLIAPEDHERLFENIRDVLLVGESTYGNEYTVIAKDGTRIPVASYSSAIVRADKVIGLRGVCVDIRKLKEAEEVLKRSHEELEKLVAERTAELELMNEQLKKEILDRVRVQEELASSEERFRGIFETARDCVFIKDRSLRYTLVNPYMASLLELPASEIVGKLDSDLFDKADAEHLRAVDSRVLEGEVVEEEHSRIVRGTRLTFLNVKAPLCNTRGGVIGICGISRDITERVCITSPELPTSVQYKSRAMTAAVITAQLAASSDSTVLLTGESGSGKDYLARYIHDHSSRSSGPFYSINCAAIPAELAESELFGHESGAFTGATKRKRGLLEIAEGGTILLNEIAELTPELQAKLLSFLDTRTLTRVGGEKVFTVNVRLVAATNRNLLAEVSAGRFRQDLFYRLDVFSIGVPPLRERLDDLPVLVQELMSQLAPAFGYSGGNTIHPRALDKMRRYPWPGNVRELRNVVERALILSGGAPPRVEHFQLERHEAIAESVPVSFPMHRPLSDVLDELEKSFVEEALSRSGGNKTDAARLLGISRFALARHMRKLGVSSDSMP